MRIIYALRAFVHWRHGHRERAVQSSGQYSPRYFIVMHPSFQDRQAAIAAGTYAPDRVIAGLTTATLTAPQISTSTEAGTTCMSIPAK